MKLRIISILISSLFFVMLISHVRAQDTGSAQATLQRPTLVSTGLPPVNQQSPSSATATTTPSPTRTSTNTPTRTPTFTRTPTQTASNTATLTRTPTDTATATFTVSSTISVTPSITATVTNTTAASATTTSTGTASEEPTATATATYTATSTATLTATLTATSSPTATQTATVTETAVPINVVSSSQSSDDGDGGGLGALFLVGIFILVVVSVYVISYALNASALDRYDVGFPLQICPVCGEGHLEIEERPYRSLGIPRVRRTVRCNNCRSILREVGRRRWRYSVDPNANPEMFREYNNTIMTESVLIELARDIEPSSMPPSYIDDEG